MLTDWIKVDPLPLDEKVREKIVTLSSGPFGTILALGDTAHTKTFRVYWVHDGTWYQLTKVG